MSTWPIQQTRDAHDAAPPWGCTHLRTMCIMRTAHAYVHIHSNMNPDRTGRLLMGKHCNIRTFVDGRNLRTKPTNGIYERHHKRHVIRVPCSTFRTFVDGRNVRTKHTDGIYERHHKPAKLLGSCKRLVATTGEPSPPMN